MGTRPSQRLRGINAVHTATIIPRFPLRTRRKSDTVGNRHRTHCHYRPSTESPGPSSQSKSVQKSDNIVLRSRRRAPACQAETPCSVRIDTRMARPGRHRHRRRRPNFLPGCFRRTGEFRGLWSAQVAFLRGRPDRPGRHRRAGVQPRPGRPFLTTLAYSLTYLPPIVGGPLLSGLADLFPRRRVMITVDLVRGRAGGDDGAPPYAVRRSVHAAVRHGPAGPSVLGGPLGAAADVLPPEEFVTGPGIGNVTVQISQIAGLVLGAGAAMVLGADWALALDALSFCLSATIIARWVVPRPAPVRETEPQPSLLAVTREGAALIFGHPLLRTLVFFGWLAGFAVVPEGLAAPYAPHARRWPAHCRPADGGHASRNDDWRVRDRPSGQALGPDAPDGLAGHALLRPADRQPAASAVLAGAGALGARRCGRGVPSRRGGGLRPGVAGLRARTGIRHGPVWAASRAGARHPGRGRPRRASRPTGGGGPGRHRRPGPGGGARYRLEPAMRRGDRDASDAPRLPARPAPVPQAPVPHASLPQPAATHAAAPQTRLLPGLNLRPRRPGPPGLPPHPTCRCLRSPIQTAPPAANRGVPDGADAPSGS